MIHRIWKIAALTGMALAAVAGVAGAARVEVVEVGDAGLVGQELRLNAAAGEQNRHRARPAGSSYVVTNAGGSPVTPGPGCVDSSPAPSSGERVTCSGSNVIRSRFDLGGLADLLIATPMNIQVIAYGGTGADDLRGGERGDILSGGAGIDGLRGSLGRDQLRGGDGADVMQGGAADDRMLGSGKSDNLTGDAGDDLLNGGGGPDYLEGSGGRDEIIGARGNDRIVSSTGGSLLSYDGVADVVKCGPGFDRVAADRKDRLSGCERVTFG